MDTDLRKKEISKKYGINFEELEREQINLAKELKIKDKIDISLAEFFGAVDSLFIKNKILTCFIVCNKDFEIVDQSYIFEKTKFPYIPGFRNYRELPSIIGAFEKLNEKPDLVFVGAHGIMHPKLGLASHFGLVTGVPSIGVSSSLIDCKARNEDGAEIKREEEKLGRVLIVKNGSNPLFISPGNNLSIETAYKISKKLTILPHKKPEPMHLASKYLKSVKKEVANYNP